KHGIQFFVVPHLKNTFLDGAAMILEKKRHVIVLTLRYDRIDNFWFCLLHELAHLTKHLTEDEPDIIIDEIEPRRSSIEGTDMKEKEADRIAQNALIPEEYWKKVNLEAKDLVKEVAFLSEQLKIHPAIAAGRIRFEINNYRILSQFISRGEVRELFESISN
ncbi:MAG: ImmA/IrrE family metallo-endopeptidase, partial [Candidatus Aminicenantes bacterium]|nr:ImmA/IrrE family metallo-endopeptidase [Candidatus Aminicenantes bacterium]